jgi:hypothetical protein
MQGERARGNLCVCVCVCVCSYMYVCLYVLPTNMILDIDKRARGKNDGVARRGEAQVK